MSKKTFTEKAQKQLALNPYVKAVSDKGITYTDEFKRLFVSEYEKGKVTREIFEEAGFDVDMIGIPRMDSARKRWCAAYQDKGVLGLEDTRKHASGRPRERELTLEEKYERLQAKNALLQAENELLKKLDLAERKLMKKKSN
jgi:transposase